MSLRKKLIAGNWKMNKTSAEALSLSKEIVAEVGKVIDVEIVVCPPFTSIETVAKVVDGLLAGWVVGCVVGLKVTWQLSPG